MERSSIQDHARRFDALYEEGYLDRPTAHHRLVLQNVYWLRDRGCRSVLDVGCGRGYLLRELSILGFEVTGTEIVPELLGRSLKRFLVYPYSVPNLVDIGDGSFDAVLGIDLIRSLRDVDEVEEFLRHARRIATRAVLLTSAPPRDGELDEDGRTVRDLIDTIVGPTELVRRDRSTKTELLAIPVGGSP